jgi:RNA polymerase sigma-70 factor (ECF subfamily)
VVRLVVPPRPEPARKEGAPTDEALVKAVQAGERWAAAALLERYSAMVERLLRRVLGHDQEIEDLVQDALTTVLTSIHQVRDGAAVKGWVAQIAIHTAHRAIRKRRLYRWLLFWYPKTSEEVESPVGSRDALRRVYAAMEELPAEERVPFALRFMDEMPLEDVAAACGVSLATIKRRLARAEKKFLAIAKRDAALAACVEEGDRWTME